MTKKQLQSLNVSMGEVLRTYVNSQVMHGPYETPSEVVRDALRMHMRSTESLKRTRDALIAELDAASQRAARGEALSLDEVRRRTLAIVNEGEE